MGNKNLDLGDAINIGNDIYWIGLYDEESKLNSNPYLIVDSNEEAVLVDPGSIPDFPIVMRKIIDVINPSKISTIIVMHQDPDVCGNLPVMEDVIDRDDLKIVAHSTTHRLIYHYGIQSELYSTDENNNKLVLDSGRELQFIYTPYLHSPGAIVTYDTKTKSLFSSDIFGSIAKSGTICTNSSFPGSMDSWHQTIMPSNSILKGAMEVFEGMDIEQILPQHGALIQDENVDIAIQHLKTLPCGYDVINIG